MLEGFFWSSDKGGKTVRILENVSSFVPPFVGALRFFTPLLLALVDRIGKCLDIDIGSVRTVPDFDGEVREIPKASETVSFSALR